MKLIADDVAEAILQAADALYFSMNPQEQEPSGWSGRRNGNKGAKALVILPTSRSGLRSSVGGIQIVTMSLISVVIVMMINFMTII